MEFSELDSDSDERPTRSRRLNDKTRRYLRAECFRVEKNLLIFGWVLALPVLRCFSVAEICPVCLSSYLWSHGLVEALCFLPMTPSPSSLYALLPYCRHAMIFSYACHSKSLLLICCLVLISCFFPLRIYKESVQQMLPLRLYSCRPLVLVDIEGLASRSSIAFEYCSWTLLNSKLLFPTPNIFVPS